MTRSTKSKGRLKAVSHISGEKTVPAKASKIAKGIAREKKKNATPPKASSSTPVRSPTQPNSMKKNGAAATVAAKPPKKASPKKASSKKASPKKASPKKASPKPSKSSVTKTEAAVAVAAPAKAKKKKASSLKGVRKIDGDMAAPTKKPKKAKEGPPPPKAKAQNSWKSSQQPQLPPMNHASTGGPVPWLGGSNAVHQSSRDNSSSHRSPPNSAKTLRHSIALGGFPTDGIDPRIMQQLDDELRQLERFVRLTPDEVAARHHVTRCIQETAAQRLPNAQVKAFGSFATPEVCCYTSDIDLVITGVVEVEYQDDLRQKQKRRKTIAVSSSSSSSSQPAPLAAINAAAASASDPDVVVANMPSSPETSKQDRLHRWRLALEALDHDNQANEGAPPASATADVDAPPTGSVDQQESTAQVEKSLQTSQGESHTSATAAALSDAEASSAEESDQDFADKLLPLTRRPRRIDSDAQGGLTHSIKGGGEKMEPDSCGISKGSDRSSSPLLFTICRQGDIRLVENATSTATSTDVASREFSAASSDTEDDGESRTDPDTSTLMVSLTTGDERRNQSTNQVTRATRDTCITALKRIKNKLSDRFYKGMRKTKSCQLIQARVPILKLELPVCEVDIAIDGCTGADTSLYACSQSKRFASFANVVLFLKVLLSQQKLDTPFNGGLGSYKLYVLVAYHMEQHLAQGGADRPGEVLLSLLFRYGSVKTAYLGGTVDTVFRTALSLRSTLSCDGASADLSNAYQLPQCLCLFDSCWYRMRDRLRSARDEGARPLSLLAHLIDAAQLRRDRDHRIRMSQWSLTQYAAIPLAKESTKSAPVTSSRAPPTSSIAPSRIPPAPPGAVGSPPPVDLTADQLLAGYNVSRSFLREDENRTPLRSNKRSRTGVPVLFELGAGVL